MVSHDVSLLVDYVYPMQVKVTGLWGYLHILWGFHWVRVNNSGGSIISYIMNLTVTSPFRKDDAVFEHEVVIQSRQKHVILGHCTCSYLINLSCQYPFNLQILDLLKKHQNRGRLRVLPEGFEQEWGTRLLYSPAVLVSHDT